MFGKSQVFLDTDMIRAGSDFTKTIEAALARCEVLLALISRTWLTSIGNDGRRRLDLVDDPVRAEIEAGLRRNVRIIPLLVEDAVMPTPSELPASLAALAAKQALPLSHARWQSDVAGLVKELRPARFGRRRLLLGATAGSLLSG